MEQLPLLHDWQPHPEGREQLDAARRLWWSYSKRSQFDRCLRAYYYSTYGANRRHAHHEARKERLRGLKRLTSIPMRVGDLLHLGAQVFLRSIHDGTPRKPPELKRWLLGILGEDVRSSRSRGARVLPPESGPYGPKPLSEFYFALPDVDDCVRQGCERLSNAIDLLTTAPVFSRFRCSQVLNDALIEKKLNIRTPAYRMTAKVDLGFHADGRFEIVDWKIGSAQGAAESLQLHSYALAVSRELQLDPGRVHVNVASVEEGLVQSASVDSAALDRVELRIIQDLERMAQMHRYGSEGIADAFTPVNKPRVCASCPFQEVCPRGNDD